MTFLHVTQTQLQMSNSTLSRKTESNEYKHYILLYKMPKGSLTTQNPKFVEFWLTNE
jgi:hypothetical protein